jgi:transcriptional regulator with XRE-family HTH domain
MTRIKKLGFDFLIKLREEKIPPPNDLTRGMGILIKKAREEKDWNQKDLAKKIFSRQSTVSDIEQGKNEIGVVTLSLLAITLGKPISYFFPEGLLKESIIEVKSFDQQEILRIFGEIEMLGGAKLALKEMELLLNHFTELREIEENEEFPFGPTDEEIEELDSDEYEV